MNVDQLFVRTLDDLDQRSNSTDEYDVLMSAALLRKLLLDASPLVDQVNRKYRLRIRYPINGVSRLEEVMHEDEPMFWSLLEAIDPEWLGLMPALRVPIDATREQLLNRRVMRMHGTWITVHHLIDQLAHIDGAVHVGKVYNEQQKVLQAAARFFQVGGMPGGVAQVRSIGRVVVRGLVPLREAIDAEQRLRSGSQ